jgi:hypothetical protein
MIQELDTVILTRDIPEQKLCKGDLGAVVLAVVTLPADAVRAATRREIAHAGAMV